MHVLAESSVIAGLAEARRRDRLIVIVCGQGRGTTKHEPRRRGRNLRSNLGRPRSRASSIPTSLNELSLVERASYIRSRVLRLDGIDTLQAVGRQSMRVEVKHELILPDLQLLGGGGQRGVDRMDPHVLRTKERGQSGTDVCLAKQDIQRHGGQTPRRAIARTGDVGHTEVGVRTQSVVELGERMTRIELPEGNRDQARRIGRVGSLVQIAEEKSTVACELLHDDVVEVVGVGLEGFHLKPFRARDGNVRKEGKLDGSEERHFGKGVESGGVSIHFQHKNPF
jgi:hypothetical protein